MGKVAPQAAYVCLQTLYQRRGAVEQAAYDAVIGLQARGNISLELSLGHDLKAKALGYSNCDVHDRRSRLMCQ
jgi:hypothetical protein